jgi:hypothetical protein
MIKGVGESTPNYQQSLIQSRENISVDAVYVVVLVSTTGFSQGGTNPLSFQIDVKFLAA